jgi:antitoxin component of MazEF toxin-antitoxin module
MQEEKRSFIIDFGNRILNKMNFSKTICLPKQALKNLDLEEGDSLKVELVQDEDEKFLKLTPVIVEEEDEDEIRFAQELKEDDDEEEDEDEEDEK